MTTPLIKDEDERALLGGLFLRQSLLDSVAGELDASDFSEPQYGRCFELFQELHEAGYVFCDYRSVIARFNQDSEFKRVSNRDAKPFLELIGHSGIPEQVPNYLRAVLDASRRRKAIAAIDAARRGLLDDTEDSSAVVEILSQELSVLGVASAKRRPERIDHVAAEALREVREALENNSLTGIETGIEVLDALTGGLHRSEQVTCAASPGAGKTSYAIQIGIHAARLGHKVLFISLEMSQQELVLRYMCSEAGVSLQDLRTGVVEGWQIQDIEDQIANLSDVGFHILDDPNLSMSQIRAEAKRMQATVGLDVLIVDYLQLISRGKDTAELVRRELIGDSARRLKVLARELDICCVVLSQVNREGAKEERLRLFHLADSAEIERNADTVLFINRHESDATSSGTESVVIGLEKNRHGPRGEVTLLFESERTRFLDPKSQHQFIEI